MSPHYGASPIGLYTGKYAGSISQTIKNSNSPYYSPNSHDSPNSSIAFGGPVGSSYG